MRAVWTRGDAAMTPEDLAVWRIRTCIEAQMCPFCASGPWKVLAGHTRHAHGIYAAELRELAMLPKKASICSPEVHEERVAYIAANQRANFKAPDVPVKRQMSKAGVAALRASFRKMPKDRLRAGAARAGSLRSKGHTCTAPGCCNVIPRAIPRTCSPECRRQVRQVTAQRVNQARYAQSTESSSVCGTSDPQETP